MIRRAKEKDVPLIQGVIARSLREKNAADYPPAVIDFMCAHYGEKNLLDLVERGGLFLLEEAGGVRVTGGLEGEEIICLFADPDHAGRGLGRRMMAFLEEELMARQAAQAHLYASVTAVTFYEGLGYEKKEECDEPGFGRSTLMQKTLGDAPCDLNP